MTRKQRLIRMERLPDYNIYPSLLNGYQRLLDYEQVAEEPWNKVGESTHARGECLDCEIGDYRLTPEEMYVKLEAELIDTINRVEKDYGEAAEKGTAFNEVVDCLIEHRKSNNKDINIYSSVNASGVPVIKADIHGFSFDFDISLCKDVAACFQGALPQYFAESMMPTAYGNVRLYGFIDEWVGNKIVDLKTTSSYSWGKFADGWQKHVYPWCVVESGLTTEVESFTYYVVEWAYQRQGEPLKAKGIYEETYTYDHQTTTDKLRGMLESFIEWLELRRDFIQDKKIFGGENEEGWHGEPVDLKRLESIIFKAA